ncbi:hypothetical protein IMY05_C4445000700 [Salix suchowensis]|nr:hypothetical protein IMY05_C4445000700 [Salix suchowensis]
MPKGVSLRSLTFGDDGRILVTGSEYLYVVLFPCLPAKLGQVTTLVWADQPRRDMVDGSAVLCVGSGRGFIGMVPFSKTYEGIVTGIVNTAAFPLDHPIESVAYDSVLGGLLQQVILDRSRCIEFSHRVRCRSASTFTYSYGGLRRLGAALAGSVLQSHTHRVGVLGPQNDKIIATLLQSGDMYVPFIYLRRRAHIVNHSTCYSSATGPSSGARGFPVPWVRGTQADNTPSGGSALSQDSSKLLVNNLTTNNFDLFSFPDIIKLRTFTIPETSTSHKIKMGIFAGISNELVLCGSLHDKVYLFDSVTGACLGDSITAKTRRIQVLPTERPKNAVETKGTFTLLGLLTDTRFLVILLGLHVTYSTWYPYASQVNCLSSRLKSALTSHLKVYHIAVYPSITWLNNFYHSIVAYISAA